MAQQENIVAIKNYTSVGKEGGNLPMLSYRNIIDSFITSNDKTWSDFSPDSIHPNDYGHAIYVELIWKYLNSVYKQLDWINTASCSLLDKQITNDIYENANIITPENFSAYELGGFNIESITYSSPYYSSCWHNSESEEALKFKVNFRNFGLLYYQKTQGNEIYDIYIDGNLINSLNTAGSYNDPISKELFNSTEAKEHTVEIKINESSENKNIYIQGLLVS